VVQFPESVLEVVAEAARKYASDIPKAVEEAEFMVRKLPEFSGLVRLLVRGAVQDLVYEARHQDNVRMRRAAGDYGGPAKVDAAAPGVVGAHESLYLYRIAGTTLGLIKGADLKGIAESERRVAEGHAFNAALCEALAALVPEDKRVEEAVLEKRLRGIFRRLRRQKPGEAA
jgi:hypothetical protein